MAGGSDAVGNLFGDDGSVHRGALKHRDGNRRDRLAPIGLELIRP